MNKEVSFTIIVIPYAAREEIGFKGRSSTYMKNISNNEAYLARTAIIVGSMQRSQSGTFKEKKRSVFSSSESLKSLSSYLLVFKQGIGATQKTISMEYFSSSVEHLYSTSTIPSW